MNNLPVTQGNNSVIPSQPRESSLVASGAKIKTVSARQSTWRLFFGVIVFVLIGSYALGIGQGAVIVGGKSGDAPLVILPTQTPDLAALAIMNATATAVSADAEYHDGNSDNKLANNAIINDAVSQATATAASSNLAAMVTANSVSAGSQVVAASATEEIHRANVNAQKTVIAQVAIATVQHLERLSTDAQDLQTERETRRETTTTVQSTMMNAGSSLIAISMVVALAFAIVNSESLQSTLQGLRETASQRKPRLATLTSGSKSKTQLRKQRATPVRDRPKRETKPQPPNVSLDDEIEVGEAIEVEIDETPSDETLPVSFRFSDKLHRYNVPAAIAPKAGEMAMKLLSGANFSKRVMTEFCTETQFRKLRDEFLELGFAQSATNNSTELTPLGRALMTAIRRATHPTP